MLAYYLDSYQARVNLLRQNFKFYYFPGSVGGWGEIEIKAKSAQLERELGLSLAILNKDVFKKEMRVKIEIVTYHRI